MSDLFLSCDPFPIYKENKMTEKSSNKVLSNKFKIILSFFCWFCPIWIPIFSYFSMNKPELGAEINPGMAFNPFPSSIWIRQDSNPQPLDCESSLLTTRPDLRPKSFELSNSHSYSFRLKSLTKLVCHLPNLCASC